MRLAEEDLSAAAVLPASDTTAMRIVGFLSQQAAEKALRAGDPGRRVGMAAPRADDGVEAAVPVKSLRTGQTPSAIRAWRVQFAIFDPPKDATSARPLGALSSLP